MYLKFLWHLYCLGWLKTSEELRREENKVDFLEWQFRNENSSFIQKKTGHSFKLSLSICFFHRCIFNLEKQNFGLENHRRHGNRAPAMHFIDGCSFFLTKVSIPFIPLPTKKHQTSQKHKVNACLLNCCCKKCSWLSPEIFQEVPALLPLRRLCSKSKCRILFLHIYHLACAKKASHSDWLFVCKLKTKGLFTRRWGTPDRWGNIWRVTSPNM